jgi:hypothetical protein
MEILSLQWKRIFLYSTNQYMVFWDETIVYASDSYRAIVKISLNEFEKHGTVYLAMYPFHENMVLKMLPLELFPNWTAHGQKIILHLSNGVWKVTLFQKNRIPIALLLEVCLEYILLDYLVLFLEVLLDIYIITKWK